MNNTNLIELLDYLCQEQQECEWLEFKTNNASPKDIGKRISALSNGACLKNQRYGYLIFGIEDGSKKKVGTKYNPKKEKVKGEVLENWIINRLNPGIDFKIYEFSYNSFPIVIFEIPAANNQPTKFDGVAYIRINEATRELNKFPEKERALWEKLSELIFEKGIALSNIDPKSVIELLDTQKYFALLGLPYPTNRSGVLDALLKKRLIQKNRSKYDITNLGGILFAKDLTQIDSLSRKSVRVIVYESNNKLNTLKTYTETSGYALAYELVVSYVLNQIPQNEVIRDSIRESVRMYPEIAIRELIANALIHQDFTERGTSVMIEIYSDRLEITNPGKPIITTVRFIDEFQSRNEKLALLMRLFGICEEQGSGIDKVITSVEHFQLPPPNFSETDRHTKATLFSHKPYKDMQKKDRIRACYQHCALKYVNNEQMTNTTLRERFNISKNNASMASRIIDATEKAKLIKPEDPDNKANKFASYIPFWA